MSNSMKTIMENWRRTIREFDTETRLEAENGEVVLKTPDGEFSMSPEELMSMKSPDWDDSVIEIETPDMAGRSVDMPKEVVVQFLKKHGLKEAAGDPGVGGVMMDKDRPAKYTFSDESEFTVVLNHPHRYKQNTGAADNMRHRKFLDDPWMDSDEEEVENAKDIIYDGIVGWVTSFNPNVPPSDILAAWNKQYEAGSGEIKKLMAQFYDNMARFAASKTMPMMPEVDEDPRIHLNRFDENGRDWQDESDKITDHPRRKKRVLDTGANKETGGGKGHKGVNTKRGKSAPPGAGGA